MGFRHLHGIGVTKNCSTAAVYYEIAANAAIDARQEQFAARAATELRNAKSDTPFAARGARSGCGSSASAPSARRLHGRGVEALEEGIVHGAEAGGVPRVARSSSRYLQGRGERVRDCAGGEGCEEGRGSLAHMHP